MSTTTIARRYAEAYFDLAQAADDLPGWRVGLARAAEVLATPEVAATLRNPRVRLADRTRFALDVLDGLEAPARNLVRLVVERQRTSILNAVLEHYDLLADRASGIVRAEVRSAVPLDDEAQGRIAKALKARLGADVQTVVTEDPALIGGLVIRIADRVIDGSVRTRLQQLQAALA